MPRVVIATAFRLVLASLRASITSDRISGTCARRPKPATLASSPRVSRILAMTPLSPPPADASRMFLLHFRPSSACTGGWSARCAHLMARPDNRWSLSFCAAFAHDFRNKDSQEVIQLEVAMLSMDQSRSAMHLAVLGPLAWPLLAVPEGQRAASSSAASPEEHAELEARRGERVEDCC